MQRDQGFQIRLIGGRIIMNWLRKWLYRWNITIIFINVLLRNGNKKFILLTFVPHKVFFIAIVAKDFKLSFGYFYSCWLIDLERRRGKRETGGSVMWNKWWFFIWVVTTYCASLSLWVASSHILGRAIKTWAWVVSLRPLINHFQNKVSDIPMVWKVSCWKKMMWSSIVLDYLSLVKWPWW